MIRNTMIAAAAVLVLTSGAAFAQSASQLEVGGTWQAIDGNRAVIWVPATAHQAARGVVLGLTPDHYAANGATGTAIR